MEKITSKDNCLIKEYVKLVSSKKERDEANLFVIEGVKLVLEAYKSKIMLQYILITKDCLNKYGDVLIDVINENRCILITENIENKISRQKTPQGIYAIAVKLDKILSQDKIYNSGKYLFLCDLQDTGNVGTMIRTAEAIGINGIISTMNTCDIYHPKVIRGSMGSVFRMPFLIVKDPVCFLHDLTMHNVLSYASVLDKTAEPISDVSFSDPAVMLIGNEGNGLDDVVADACSKRVTIKMSGNSESLNASIAACIIMWEMTK